MLFLAYVHRIRRHRGTRRDAARQRGESMTLQADLGAIDNTGKLVLCIVGVIVLYEVFEWAEGMNDSDADSNPIAKALANIGHTLGVPDPNDTVGNPNSPGDTSSANYAGWGIFGWLGNIANQLSGGLLQSSGTALGGAAFDAAGGGGDSGD